MLGCGLKEKLFGYLLLRQAAIVAKCYYHHLLLLLDLKNVYM